MTRTASLADLAGAIDAGPLAGFRNVIINGNFDIWQRGTSGTTSYVADRWAGGATGSTIAQSRQAFSLGQTDVPNEPTYFHRTVVTSSAGASNFSILSQLVEDVRTFAAQTVTLSFWAKADASKNMAVEFQQVFGTGGSPSTAVSSLGVTTCALTTSWKKFSVVLTLPSISGKTLGSDNNSNLRLNFWFDAGSSFNSRTNSLGQQSGTFDIAQVQLEAGPVATPFERRPIGTELALCQRYYEKYYNVDVAPGTSVTASPGQAIFAATNSDATGGPISGTCYFKVVKRSAPTGYIWDLAGNASRVSNDTANNNKTISSGSVLSEITQVGYRYDFVIASASNNRGFWCWAVDAEL